MKKFNFQGVIQRVFNAQGYHYIMIKGQGLFDKFRATFADASYIYLLAGMYVLVLISNIAYMSLVLCGIGLLYCYFNIYKQLSLKI